MDGTIIGYSPEAIVAACADDVVWEDLCAPEPHEGRAAVFAALSAARAAADASAGARVVVERRSDGTHAAGFTWHRAETNGGDDASRGLRGTTFVELDAEGRVRYVRECAEPILKPGAPRRVCSRRWRNHHRRPRVPSRRRARPRMRPISCRTFGGKCRHLRFREEALRNFSESIVYEDLNFDAPFVGKTATAAFLEEFDIPGLAFVPDRISDGDRACCFTWEVDLGVEGAARVGGYLVLRVRRRRRRAVGVGGGSVRVTYVRDIPEPTMKPPPLQALAAAVNPATRVFAAVPPEREMVASARDR